MDIETKQTMFEFQVQNENIESLKIDKTSFGCTWGQGIYGMSKNLSKDMIFMSVAATLVLPYSYVSILQMC